MKKENGAALLQHGHGEKTDRIAWVDVFRTVMIFAIAWGHALCAEPTADGLMNRYIYSFHVPAFFFISGYMFGNKGEGFFRFAAKKIRTLMLPYYIFSLISISLFYLLGGVASTGLGVAIKSTELLPNLLGMLYGNGATGYMKWNLPLWFIPCLFCAVLLFYGMTAAIAAVGGNRKRDAAMGCLLAVCLILAFLNYCILHISKLPFGLETAVYMLPFMVAGHWFRLHNGFEHLQGWKKCLPGILLVAAGALVGIFAQPRVDYPSARFASLPLFYLAAFLSVTGYAMLAQLVRTHKLAYVGRNTLAILVMHKFPIVFMQLFLIGAMERAPLPGVLIAFVIALTACALSLLAGQVICRIAPFALGRKGRTRHLQQ